MLQEWHGSVPSTCPLAYPHVGWSLTAGCTNSILKLRWTLAEDRLCHRRQLADSKTVIDNQDLTEK